VRWSNKDAPGLGRIIADSGKRPLEQRAIRREIVSRQAAEAPWIVDEEGGAMSDLGMARGYRSTLLLLGVAFAVLGFRAARELGGVEVGGAEVAVVTGAALGLLTYWIFARAKS